MIRELKVINPSILPHTVVLTAAADRALHDFEGGRGVNCIMRKPFDLAPFVDAVVACCSTPAPFEGMASTG